MSPHHDHTESIFPGIYRRGDSRGLADDQWLLLCGAKISTRRKTALSQSPTKEVVELSDDEQRFERSSAWLTAFHRYNISDYLSVLRQFQLSCSEQVFICRSMPMWGYTQPTKLIKGLEGSGCVSLVITSELFRLSGQLAKSSYFFISPKMTRDHRLLSSAVESTRLVDVEIFNCVPRGGSDGKCGNDRLFCLEAAFKLSTSFRKSLLGRLRRRHRFRYYWRPLKTDEVKQLP